MPPELSLACIGPNPSACRSEESPNRATERLVPGDCSVEAAVWVVAPKKREGAGDDELDVAPGRWY